MEDTLTILTVNPHSDDPIMNEVRELLDSVDIGLDGDVEIMAVAKMGDRLVGCLGLAGPVLKSAAVDHDAQGTNVLGRLLVEVRYLALERGYSALFVYTKPRYTPLFAHLGFHVLAEVPDLIVLMEDDPNGLANYVAELAKTRVEGKKIGGIVVNANPFTLGHRHLIHSAAQQCDVVHVFVVGEDVSEFSYEDRFALVKAGVADMEESDRIVVHPGSRYVVSRASFPQYFLKDDADITRAFTGIDLQIFRNHVAPALGIRHRFVGTEPASEITACYNEEMCHWLSVPSEYPPIDVHVIDRVGEDGVDFISASKVRKYIADGDLENVAKMVPPTTFDFIKANCLEHHRKKDIEV